jgi:arylsulfatase A-like enzyme
VGSNVATIRDVYSTDYLAQEAMEFINGAEPFLCIITPTQPHSPSVPRRDLTDAWSDFRWPVVDEADVSDKPPWIQRLPPVTEDDMEQIIADARGALRELSAVDDMVNRIVSAMDPDVLDNTVVIFTSDNGIHLGEHRRRGSATKSGQYDVGLHVPMVVRGPGFEPGAEVTTASMVFQDINSTMRHQGGARAGLPHQAGVSLAAMAAAPAEHASRMLLHAIGQGFEAKSGDDTTTGPTTRSGSASSTATRRRPWLPTVRSRTRRTTSMRTRRSQMLLVSCRAAPAAQKRTCRAPCRARCRARYVP